MNRTVSHPLEPSAASKWFAATAVIAYALVSLIPLVWMANHLSQRGFGLQAGDVVTTGVITEVFACELGDEVRGEYAGLGAVEVRF